MIQDRHCHFGTLSYFLGVLFHITEAQIPHTICIVITAFSLINLTLIAARPGPAPDSPVSADLPSAPCQVSIIPASPARRRPLCVLPGQYRSSTVVLAGTERASHPSGAIRPYSSRQRNAGQSSAGSLLIGTDSDRLWGGGVGGGGLGGWRLTLRAADIEVFPVRTDEMGETARVWQKDRTIPRLLQ